MKKSNIIIYVVLSAASVFLLWLWFFLGLNQVDAPLDLFLSIIWWVIIAAAVFTIIKVESHRKEKIRTVYVGDNELFNSELGKLEVGEPEKLVDTVEEILNDLDYDFSKNEFPKKEEFDPRYVIRTLKIKDNSWEGSVVNVWTKIETQFKNRDELTKILSAQGA